jgi:hypothetical protein
MKSVYSKELHVAIPTLDYIKLMTGIDVILEEGNKERAEGKVISLTAKARDFLYVDKSGEAQMVISYLIYTETWLDMWLNYVVKYIEATFYYGDESSWEKTPRPIENAIYGSLLHTKMFVPRIAYEARDKVGEY